MSDKSIDRKKIESLLPHREPMLLIDELTNIKKLHSATAIMNVKKDAFYVQGHFPDNPVMPGVLIVEAFGQAAAALTAAQQRCRHGSPEGRQWMVARCWRVVCRVLRVRSGLCPYACDRVVVVMCAFGAGGGC